MSELCDSIFMEDDITKAKEMFLNACDICNKYFTEDIFRRSGYSYSFKVYNGADELKNRLSNGKCVNNQQLNSVFEKDNWNNEDKKIIKAALDETEQL